jgi:hypothetical protein
MGRGVSSKGTGKSIRDYMLGRKSNKKWQKGINMGTEGKRSSKKKR